MTDIMKKNAAIMTTKKILRLRKSEVLQKLNDVVMLKLAQTMKKTVKTDENIIDDD